MVRCRMMKRVWRVYIRSNVSKGFPVACAGICEHREKGDDGFKEIRGILYISKRAYCDVLELHLNEFFVL